MWIFHWFQQKIVCEGKFFIRKQFPFDYAHGYVCGVNERERANISRYYSPIYSIMWSVMKLHAHLLFFVLGEKLYTFLC